MAKTRPALGRGLSALIPETLPSQMREHPTEVDLDRLTPNRFQPRTVMDEPKLEELSRSIESSGVIQPIIVRRLDGDTFEIVAGERRWRAAQQAGLLRVESLRFLVVRVTVHFIRRHSVLAELVGRHLLYYTRR